MSAMPVRNEPVSVPAETGAKSGLRILFVLVPAFHPNDGGVQMSTYKLSTHFAEKGHRVSVFSFSGHGHLETSSVRIHHPSSEGIKVDEKSLTALRETLRVEKPEIVINQMPYEQTISEFLFREKSYLLLGCLRNTLFSVRANLEEYVKKVTPGPFEWLAAFRSMQNLYLWLHRQRHKAQLEKILAAHDVFIMFGPPNMDELRYFIPNFDESRIGLIPNSIPEVCELVPGKAKRFLWLGRVEHGQKRADLIIPIWQKLSRKLVDWELDVVGDGPLLNELKEKAKAAGLDRIHFHGRQSPAPFYQSASIFFMTSVFEGFPNTLVEAQSFGCVPVVFDSYPMAKWILPDAAGGVRVPRLDVEKMVEALHFLASDHEGRHLAAQQSLDNARRFHIEKVGEHWETLFTKLLNTRVDGVT